MNDKIDFSWNFIKNVTEALDSYRIRAFIDAKDEILDCGVYNENQFYNILFKMIDEEKLKFELYNYLKNKQDNRFSIIKQFSEEKRIEIKKVLSLLELLKVEGLISLEEINESNQNEDVNESFTKNFEDILININKSSIEELKPIYEPVKIIFNSKICSGCGICAGICPMDCIDIQNGYGEIDEDKCIRCGLCYFVCPRSFLPVEILNIYQNKASEIKNYGKLGHYLEAYAARTKVKEIKDVCQDGGVSSTCILYLLDNNEIDLALGAKIGDNPWCPEPTIIENKEDIMKTAGTKYVNNPNLKLLNKFNLEKEKRIAVVGVPCMMEALLKSKIYDINIPSLNSVKYRIGIFCMESFSYEQGFLKICEKLNVNVKDIKKTDINKGKFLVYTNNDEELSVPIKEITHLAREDCEVCYDLTSESADISIGSIGAPSGWNSVLIRTKKGKELFDALIKNDLIESKLIEEVKPGLELLKKIASGKKKKSYKQIIKKLEQNKKAPIY
jgi:coenzyme F420 hydrogenase subunit beta